MGFENKQLQYIRVFLLILILLIALFLEIVSLWQLEIVFIDIYWQHEYCFPFQLYCTYQLWIARDWLYLLNAVAFSTLLFYILFNIRKSYV